MSKQELISLLMMEKISAEVRRRGRNYAKGYDKGIDLAIKLIEASKDELPRPVVPQYIAEWIDYCKWRKISLAHALYRSDESVDERVFYWIVDSLENQETFALAWIFGYTVEKEKKYTVRMKATKQYLCNDETGPHFSPNFRSNFTKTNLEELGFD